MEKEFTKEAVSQAIRRFRSSHDLSQQQLANKIGVSNMQIMRWENGLTIPNLLSIKALKELKVLT